VQTQTKQHFHNFRTVRDSSENAATLKCYWQLLFMFWISMKHWRMLIMNWCSSQAVKS